MSGRESHSVLHAPATDPLESADIEDDEEIEDPETSIRLPVLCPTIMSAEEDAMWESGKSYSYVPLGSNQIRLLRLQLLDSAATQWDLVQPILSTMHTVDLEQHPEYDALSYTWGNPLGLYESRTDVYPAEAWAKRNMIVIIDGQEVHVAQNLYTALLSLRWTASNRQDSVQLQFKEAGIGVPDLIWIDALCINQTDVDERNAQEAIMHRIYRQARSTWAWLGGQDDIALVAQSVIQVVAGISPMRNDLIGADLTDPETYELAGISFIPPAAWACLYAFANRSWFKRAWIVQEVAVAKQVNVICGLTLLSLASLQSIFEQLRLWRWWEPVRELVEPCIEGVRNPEYHSERQENVDPNFKLYQSSIWPSFDFNVLAKIVDVAAGLGVGPNIRPLAKPHCLRRLLREHRFTMATDPRDKIYAFQQLSAEFVSPENELLKRSLAPDYRRPVTDVFVDAAKSIIQHENGLLLLSVVQDDRETKLENLPSWVPDFTAQGWPNPIGVDHPTPWCASAGLGGYLFSAPANGFELPVQGVCLGSVVELVDYSVLASTPPGFMDFVGLPATSQIARPTMTDKLREFYRITDLEPWKLQREKPMCEADIAKTSILQSRLQVLWRTLLLDCFQGQHPAPAECGTAFDTMVRRTFLILESTLLQFLGSGLLDRWESGKQVLTGMHEDWQRLADVPPRDRLPMSLEFMHAMQEFEAMAPEEKGLDVIGVAITRLTAEKFGNSLPTQAEMSFVNEVEAKMKQNAVARHLCVIDSKPGFNCQLAYGPQSLVRGDEVWLLVGADLPFILRNVDEGIDKLIGGAYVHGAMHGEREAASKDFVEVLV